MFSIFLVPVYMSCFIWVVPAGCSCPWQEEEGGTAGSYSADEESTQACCRKVISPKPVQISK